MSTVAIFALLIRSTLQSVVAGHIGQIRLWWTILVSRWSVKIVKSVPMRHSLEQGFPLGPLFSGIWQGWLLWQSVILRVSAETGSE